MLREREVEERSLQALQAGNDTFGVADCGLDISLGGLELVAVATQQGVVTVVITGLQSHDGGFNIARDDLGGSGLGIEIIELGLQAGNCLASGLGSRDSTL